MAVINPAELGIGVEIRGKLGAPSAYGSRKYGGFEYGSGADFSGIYQVRTRFNRRVQVRMKHYVPTNPKTEAQQAWRAIFNDGVVAWQALNQAQQDVYNERSKYKNYSGFNLFVREYLNANK